MRVHLMPDEKFIDAFIELSEEIADPGGNVYFVRKKEPFQLVNHPLAKAKLLGDSELELMIDALGEGDEVYLHFMGNDVTNWLANRKPLSARVTWIFWGAEFFQFMDNEIYSPYTKAYTEAKKATEEAKINATKFSRFPILNQYRRYLYKEKIKKTTKLHFDTYQNALDRVDTIMHYNQLDVDLIKSVFNYRGGFQYFHYPAAVSYNEVENFIQNNKPPIEIKPNTINLWIANSASASSNHKDAVMKIKALQNPNIHIWMPANYGNADYLAFLEQEVAPIMPGQVTLITDYMSFGMFAATIAAMDVSVLWHIRSQAFGNVQMLLYLGKKVFMHPQSTLYQMLIAQGYKIWSIDDIDNDTLASKLSEEDNAINRQKIALEFSKQGSKATIENAYLRSTR